MTPDRALMSTGIEQDVPLARYTTVGIGGPARGFARPESIGDLQRAFAWAAERGVAVVPMGLGSNVLVPDEGVDALVLRLAGELASVHVEGELLVAGGGATNAVCLHQARAAGLGGFEFACAIPGTAGGGVRMNAGAYGREWKDVVERAVVVDTRGEPGQVVASVEFQLEPDQPQAIKARIADLQRQRKATQPTNKRTFGSVFKTPDHELGAGQILEACGLKGYRIGGALISPRHANFIENAGGATAVDALGLMAEARRRALETFGVVLEREVELLGGLELPPAGETL